MVLTCALFGMAAQAVASAPVTAEATMSLEVPSGQPVTFHDIITDVRGEAGLTYRFRFIAPWIAGPDDFVTAEQDMIHLCEYYALPRLANIGPKPTQIVISLADRPVEFGVVTPDAVQFFEAYRPEGAACIWDQF